MLKPPLSFPFLIAIAVISAVQGADAQAAPPAPEAAVLRSGSALQLQAKAPPGTHLNPDAPTTLELGQTMMRGPQVLKGGRLPWVDAEGPVPVRANLGLCSDLDGSCWTSTLEAIMPAGRPPRRLPLQLATADAAPHTPPATEGPVAVGDVTQRWGDVVRIYDFSAVWCPPCQAMRLDVLENPGHASTLRGVALQIVDVDMEESWPLKDRYAVTGYPTLVAVDAAGQERGRLIGYPGQQALLDWLSALSSAPPIEQLRAGPPAHVDPAAAAARALDLARRGELEAADRWLAVADPNAPDTRAARLIRAPTSADIDALLAIGRAGPWIADALAFDPARLTDLGPLVAQLPPDQAADALWVAASSSKKSAPDTAAQLKLGARLLYEGLLTGDLERDRPRITSLAQLRAETGDLNAALALLSAAAAHFPDEFTFHHAAAGLLVDARRWTEAEAEARAALARARGDQRLRAVQPLAHALEGQGRRAEAIEALRATRAAQPAPPPDIQVRTTRYLDQVDAQLRMLSEKGP